jgi:hypothetical protein
MQGSPCKAASVTVHQWWTITRSDSACSHRLPRLHHPSRDIIKALQATSGQPLCQASAQVLTHECYRSTLCTHRPPSNGGCGSTRR